MFALKAHKYARKIQFYSVSFINMVALITYALSQPSALEQIYSLATGVVGMVSTVVHAVRKALYSVGSALIGIAAASGAVCKASSFLVKPVVAPLLHMAVRNIAFLTMRPFMWKVVACYTSEQVAFHIAFTCWKLTYFLSWFIIFLAIYIVLWIKSKF